MSDGFSLKAAVSELSGRGVGLSAVRSVVTALGGRIEIDSKLGQGSTWRFRFPAGKLDDTTEQPESLTPRASSPGRASA
jgi:signal transduction histidine kinase